MGAEYIKGCSHDTITAAIFLTYRICCVGFDHMVVISSDRDNDTISNTIY